MPNRETLATAFNEWMRRNIEDPDAFTTFEAENARFTAEGEEPTYGDRCADYLLSIMAEQEQPAA